MVYRVAYQFAGNHFDAEDIAQEVFIKVYRSLDKFRQDAQLSSWMYRIVMNACIDHRRRAMPSGGAFGEEAEHKMMNTPEETPGPEERAYAGELGQVLEVEIGRLPPGQRVVFVMRHHQGLKLGKSPRRLVWRKARSSGSSTPPCIGRGALNGAKVTAENAHEMRSSGRGNHRADFYGELPQGERP